MASTNPSHSSDADLDDALSTASIGRTRGALAGAGDTDLRRPSRRARRMRATAAASTNDANMFDGLPAWEGLRPTLLFLLFPAIMVIGITLSGSWPKAVLYPVAGLMGLYVLYTITWTAELVLACALLYLPFSTTYVIPLAPGVNGTNMLLLLGMAAAVLRASNMRESVIGWPRGTSLVFMFACFSALSGFTVTLLPGGYAYLMYSELLNYKAWLDQFLFYFILVSCIRDVEAAKRMIIYMCLGSMLLVIYSVPEMLDKMGRSSIEKSRMVGPHQQANNFGGFVAYTLMPLLGLFVVYIKDLRAWLFTPYFLIAAKVLISTFSRGAYLAIALGAFLTGYFKGRSFLLFWATVGLCFFLVFPQYIPDSVMARMDSIFESTPSTADNDKLDKSSSHRLILWRAAARMIVEDPVLGKGFKAFPRLKAGYTEQPVHESDPHSMYLYIGSQMGLPVLSLYLLTLLWSFYLGRRLSQHKNDRFIRGVGVGGAAATACYAVICLFGSRAVNLEFTCYFWAYLVCMQVIDADIRARSGTGRVAKARSNAFRQRDQQDAVTAPAATTGQTALEQLPDASHAAASDGIASSREKSRIDDATSARIARRQARRSGARHLSMKHRRDKRRGLSGR